MKAREFHDKAIHDLRGRYRVAKITTWGCSYNAPIGAVVRTACSRVIDNGVPSMVIMDKQHAVTCPECLQAMRIAERRAELAAH